jgi:hypothetical protein
MTQGVLLLTESAGTVSSGDSDGSSSSSSSSGDALFVRASAKAVGDGVPASSLTCVLLSQDF